jgi:gliding motility-associated-like protein
MTSDGNNVDPDVANAPPIPAPGVYSPGLGYLIYSCPPTIGVVPSNVAPNDDITNDPCFIGVAGFGSNFNDINFLGGPSYAGAFNNSTIYYVPITFYDTINGYYSFVNTNIPCYSMGQPFAVQYLTEITATQVPDCQDSSVTVTISGGLPEMDGSLYTATNLLPANASFVNNTATHNGTIVINGLVDGDMYSFDVADSNGCPITITGGPFVGLPDANANVDDTVCVLTYNLNAIPSVGTGAWTGPAGVVFAPANSPTATVTVPAAGSYTFTWTEDNTGGCTDADDVTVLFNIISIPNTPTDPLCNNGNDGQIILAPQGGISPYSYQWNAAANNQTTNPATNLSAGSYTVTVTDAFGCFLDSTFVLSQPTPFTYTTTALNANCGNPDGSATVVGFAGGTPGYTYDWGAGPIASNTLANLIPGNYSVTVADNNGCDTTFSIAVGNNAPFTASITASTDATCNGAADGTATADGSDPLVAYTFLWDAAAGNQATQVANGLAAGSYLVTVTDPNTGCSDIDSVVINEPTLVVINTISPAVTICIGQNTNITATATGGSGAGYIYTWDNGLGAGQAHTVSPAVNTTYTVTAVDANNCPSAAATVTVTVNPPLTVVASADVSICPNGQTQISAVGAGGNGGPYTYTWNNGVGAGQSPQVSPAVTTTYIVTLSDNCSPDVFDSVIVTVNPAPVVTFSVDTLSICETPNRPFEFYNTTAGGTASASWLFGDGGTANGDTVSHSYPGPGTYDVTLTVTSPAAAGGCSASLTKVGYVQVYNNPTADFTTNPTTTTMFDPTVNFVDQSYSNIQSWSWNIGGLDTSNLQNPSYTFPEDVGTYLTYLTVMDNNGCVNTTSRTLIITGEYSLYVPNSFTPDGDGLNDGFAPTGFGISDKNYAFFIYDRWGELIYETYIKFEPWTGEYKGKLVPNDVYVWKVKFVDINGKSHTKIGRVTVTK